MCLSTARIEELLKVNLGSGPVGLDDWTNLDNSISARLAKFHLIDMCIHLGIVPKDRKGVRWPKNLVIRDCRKTLPFGSLSVDYIYTSHFIEHLRRYEAVGVVAECFRVLKNGGVIRVVVPDLRIFAEKYLRGDQSFFIKNIEWPVPEEGTLCDMFDLLFYRDVDISKRSKIDRIRSRFTSYHKWLYDFELLKLILEKAGFRDVQRTEYRVGRVPDIEKLDVSPDCSLHVEATKP